MSDDDSRFTSGVSNRLRIISVMDYLSETTTLDALTVADVCAAADISRASFYRLFEDKYDAVNWYITLVHRLGHAETGRTLSWRDASITSLSGYRLMGNLMTAAVTSQGYDSPNELSIRLRRSDLLASLAERLSAEIDDRLRFQVEFFCQAEIPLVNDWFVHGADVSVDEMALRVESCVPPQLHELLNKPQHPQRPVGHLSLGRLFALH